MACKTPEELLQLVETEGYALSEDELSAISGGEAWYAAHENHLCPHCGNHDTTPYWFMGKKLLVQYLRQGLPLPND